MSRALLTRLLAWAIALTLIALPIVGVLNGWFAS
jgi:cell division protein FtsQ